MSKPIFVISLDLELGWGFILSPSHKVLRILRNDSQCGRGAVYSLLKLLNKYRIPATWATVGHLFIEKDGGQDLISSNLPQFKDGWLNWDHYSQIRGSPLYAAPDVIDKISASSTPQEIGLHSFFHIPFHLCSREVAKLEVEMGINAARKRGIMPQSFIFPENRVSQADVLKEHGIKIYRGNVPRLYNKATSPLIRKAAGAISKVMAPPVQPLWKEGIMEIPGSMSFDDPLLTITLLPRAKTGLNRAIRANRVFHVWLHPWSLLIHEGLLNKLEAFLAFVYQKRDEDEIQVMTMGELASHLNQDKEGHDVSDW